ncbi:MAG: phospholipid carrier-dependent glycosyltransferase [bacterium]|nr:phospholipid carrier-dependent glycosyltransferase [bacterium]
MNDNAPAPRRELAVAAALAIGVLVLLTLQLGAPGVTWDEAYPNFPAAIKQGEWIRGLFTLDAPFSKETIDEYWFTTSDHPSPPRTLAAISRLLFSPWLDEVVTMRLPSALIGGLLAASVFLFLRESLSRTAALAGAAALMLMPRVWGHLHLFSLDAPIMAWWFWAALAGYHVIERRWPAWIFGLAYAAAFSTKLHSVFLPFPLLTWAIIHIVTHGNERAQWKRLAAAIAWAAVLTPLIYIGSQPWLWHDTGQRIVERFFGYAEKTGARPIPLYYLGTIYFDNTPWHYPLVMVLFTVPPLILILQLLGMALPLSGGNQKYTWRDASGARLFLLLHFLTPLMLVILPLAQAYDGCRLFLPCFPFAACFAGWGAQLLRDKIPPLKPAVFQIALWSLLLIPGIYTGVAMSPYWLSYYNVFAGGVRGAHRLGMESTYWCDALTRDFLDEINQTLPPGASMRPLSMPFEAIDYYKSRGWLREDIVHNGDPPYDYHLLQCRQGMFRQVEWTLYRQRKPLAAVMVDGVPLFLLYGPL